MLVVKIGGSIADACRDLLDEVAARDDAVLVHGFGPQTDRVLAERGVQPRTIRSPEGVASRYTDDAVLDAMREAAARVQASLAGDLRDRGADVDRLGLEVPLLWAEAKSALRHERPDGRVLLVRGNRSGRVREARARPVEAALEAGRTPVVTPLALDGEGPVSVDADRAAAALAGALGADRLVLLTDVPRVLDGDGDPIERLDLDGIEELVSSGVARGGMVRKLVACREALEAGVERALVGDGRVEGPVGRALAGEATEVTP